MPGVGATTLLESLTDDHPAVPPQEVVSAPFPESDE